MITPSISFLGQSTAQINRLKEINGTLADLQRQISTGKKHETLAGFGGTAAQTIQRVRMDRLRAQSYLENIGTVNTRIKEMDQAMTAARKAATQLIDGLSAAVRDGPSSVATLAALSKQSLAFVQDLANLNIEGRYLFSGSATSEAPFTDANALNAGFQTEVANWLNGSNSTAQLDANVDGFTPAALGFNPALSAAGPVTVRIDDSTELDYTVRADEGGLNDIIRALGFMANLKAPDPATDIPTEQDLNEVLKHILSMVQSGAQKLDLAQTNLGAKSTLMNAIEENHEKDLATLEGLVSDIENADTAEAVTKLQSLQTQLQASYQVTSILSQLSLVNFL
jgi:flagellar hook-associated protein 3 FlgL